MYCPQKTTCAHLETHSALCHTGTTKTLNQYTQIEKALVLVYGRQKFHVFIYGWPLFAEMNHKTLSVIVKKNLGNISPELKI